MGQIVAIGGGLIRSRETFIIDKYIVELSCKKNPNVIFIPTASYDDDSYQEIFQKIYGDELNCNVKNILFTKQNYSSIELINFLNWADIIYVGGGDTKRMLEVWKQNDFFNLLKQYHKSEGKILAGLSAGAICWFKYGNSDSPLFDNPNAEIKTEKLKALGLIDAAFCPHYDKESYRREEFDNMMKNTTDCVGIALDDNCAVHFYDGNYKVIRSVPLANMHKVVSNPQVKNEIVKDMGTINTLLSF